MQGWIYFLILKVEGKLKIKDKMFIYLLSNSLDVLLYRSKRPNDIDLLGK